MRNEKYIALIVVTITLSLATIITVSILSRTTKTPTHNIIMVKGVVVGIIEDIPTPAYDYYRIEITKVLSEDEKTKELLMGTHKIINAKDGFYVKGDEVTHDVYVPK